MIVMDYPGEYQSGLKHMLCKKISIYKIQNTMPLYYGNGRSSFLSPELQVISALIAAKYEQNHNIQ